MKFPSRNEIKMSNTDKTENCPDCQEPITAENHLIDELGNPEQYGHCVACYDPTPYYPKID